MSKKEYCLRTSELPVQMITQHEIEGNCKEERETKFGDYTGDFVYGFCLWYTFHIFHYNWIQNHWMKHRFISKCCLQCSLHISVENQKLVLFFLPNHFGSHFLKILFSNFVYGFSDHVTITILKKLLATKSMLNRCLKVQLVEKICHFQ